MADADPPTSITLSPKGSAAVAEQEASASSPEASGRTVNVHAPGGQVQIGDHNVQSLGQTGAAAGVQSQAAGGGKSPDTWAGLLGYSAQKLPGFWARSGRLTKVGIVLLVVVAAALFGLTYFGSPIKALFWPQKNPPAASSGPIGLATMSTPQGPKEPTINVHAPGGQVQVGDNNVQNQTVITGAHWPDIAANDREELVRALRALQPERFVIVTGFDNDSFAIAQMLFDDLSRAGWSPMPGMGKGAPSVTRVLPGPARPGVSVFVKAPSPNVEPLLHWSHRVGLQSQLGGFATLPGDKAESVRIEIGSAPSITR